MFLRWVSIFCISSGFVIIASTAISKPHLGQISGSTSYILFINLAQVCLDFFSDKVSTGFSSGFFWVLLLVRFPSQTYRGCHLFWPCLYFYWNRGHNIVQSEGLTRCLCLGGMCVVSSAIKSVAVKSWIFSPK